MNCANASLPEGTAAAVIYRIPARAIGSAPIKDYTTFRAP
jgi:hypothetical protein